MCRDILVLCCCLVLFCFGELGVGLKDQGLGRWGSVVRVWGKYWKGVEGKDLGCIKGVDFRVVSRCHGFLWPRVCVLASYRDMGTSS